MSWIVRGVLILAGLVTGWLMAKDEPLFSIVQMTIAVLLCTLVVLVLGFWPERWTMRAKKPPPLG